MQLLSNLWAAHLVAAGSDGVMKAPSYYLVAASLSLNVRCGFFFDSFLSFSADGYQQLIVILRFL